MSDQNQDLASLLMTKMSVVGDPIRYANMIRATRSGEIQSIREMLPAMKEQLDKYEMTARHSKEFRKQVSGEGYSRRRKESKKLFEGLDQSADLFRGGAVDLSVILEAHYNGLMEVYSNLVNGAEMVVNAKMMTFEESMSNWKTSLDSSIDELGDSRIEALLGKTKEATKDALQNLALEQQINAGASQSFAQGLYYLEKLPKMFESYLVTMARLFEAYYERLRHRHSTGGMVICKSEGVPSVTLTDVSILIWENLDKVGEIESGQSKDELSAYTIHRASAMIEAAKHDAIWPWVIDPGQQLMAWARMMLPSIRTLRDFVLKMKTMLGESTWKLQTLVLSKAFKDFEDVIESLDLSQITQRPGERAFSKTERFALEHQNKAIQRVADLLTLGCGLQELVSEVLKLKVEERNFLINENSFYVTKIGTGNMFSGEAPGALEVIPGEKPNAKLDHIWGGGFDEIKSFIAGMDEARKWNPLFLSTSPSKSTDKNNILLVGPQGCGKTEVMRAIGSAPGNIAIFTVGSSFLTCWLGEAQKNPGRLFDEAVKLHKASGRPVYILIDEIDSVLSDEGASTTRVNLTTEFQNLMDGVVAYPGISIVGATNHPKRIPTPMLRRFAKVMVVGELSKEDTVAILKHYIENFLPCGEGFTEAVYEEWARRLEGATGDALRKAVDEVWLTFMRSFISTHKEAAEDILKFIRDTYGEQFDVSALTEEDRATIKGKIAVTGSVVTPEMVTVQVDKLLDNFAVQQQISTAKETYRNAKLLLERQKNGAAGVGF